MIPKRFLGLAMAVAVAFLVAVPSPVFSHCDTMSGPVITAAKKALETGDVNLVLVWVQPGDEARLRKEFDRAVEGRKAGGKSGEDAEMRLFETLVRIHRAGEGEPFTGIKPAGTDLGPEVRAADRSLETGSLAEVRNLLDRAFMEGVNARFKEAREKRGYDPKDVVGGRAYVRAYVEYLHYVEELHATPEAMHGEHGHAGHGGHAAHIPWLLAGLLGLVVIVEAAWIVSHRKR